MVRLRARPGVQEVWTDYCMWGKPWRKRTRFLIGRADPSDTVKLQRQCRGRGLCTRTGLPHVHLEGTMQGVRLTLLAMLCPAKLCHDLAAILEDNTY